jgi:hypothetical protein
MFRSPVAGAGPATDIKRQEPAMHRLAPLPAVIAAAALLAGPAPAQPVNEPGGAARFAINPSLSLTPPAQRPLQQQIQQNYRSQLLAAQRELLQTNPSGLSREQLAIAHLLNAYDATPR